MNDEGVIVSKIETVLRSEAMAYRTNGRQVGGLGSFNVNMNGGFAHSNQRGPRLVDTIPNHEVINSRSADALLRLYSQLGVSGREIFKRELIKILEGPSEYQNLSYLVYFVLFRTGEKLEPIRIALDNLNADAHPHFGRGNLLAVLGRVLTYEYDSFDSGELIKLREILSTLPQHHDAQNLDRITEIQMKMLEDELSDVNPAINVDRDKVVSFWQEVFGSNEVQDQINQIEVLFTEGTFDEAKLATCLGRVRVLLIDSLKRLAQQIAESKGLAPLAATSQDAEVINWFKEQGVLGAKEKKLVRAMYDLCSDEGAHAAFSKKEYARIAKNVTYECLVMVIGLVPR